MRASVMAVALVVLASCSSLLPSATSPRPDLTATPAAPAAGASGTGLSAPALPTPAGSGGARKAVVDTPRPPLGLPVVNALCSEWPAEVATVQTQLSMPPSLCLLRTTAEMRGDLVCTVVGCVPVTSGCVDQGYCIQAVVGLRAHYVLVFIRPPEGLPPSVSETSTLTRSLCRLHQFRTQLDAVLPGEPAAPEGWLATLEAHEFETAFTSFRATYPFDAQRWEPKISSEDNYADVCAAWYYPPARDLKVSDYTPLSTWATKWLPQ